MGFIVDDVGKFVEICKICAKKQTSNFGVSCVMRWQPRNEKIIKRINQKLVVVIM